MTTLGELGEWGAIERLTKLLPGRSDVVVDAGDDAAVVRTEAGDNDLLLTSDPLVEGIHFEADADPEMVGRKAIGRTLSDMAAMGGEPLWSLTNVVAPPSTDMNWLESVYKGAAAIADLYGMAMVGGDMAEGPNRQLHVFTVGRLPSGTALTRAGARPGDLLYVTGVLGGSRAGKHLSFEPRIAEGLWLRETGWVHALIDVTDGLASDVRHVLERSGVGADIELERVPLSDAAKSSGDDRRPVEHALADGEDFELLFAISAEHRAAFESSWEETFELLCTRIGVVTEAPGDFVCVDSSGRRTAYKELGYEHFRGTS